MRLKIVVTGALVVGALVACGGPEPYRPSLAEAREAMKSTQTVSGMNLVDCLSAREFRYLTDYDAVDQMRMVKYTNRDDKVLTLAVLDDLQVLPWRIADHNLIQLNGCTIIPSEKRSIRVRTS